MVVATFDLYLLSGLLIEPPLDHGPNGGEHVWCIDDHELSQLLRVIILTDLRSVLYQAPHLMAAHDPHREVRHVQNGEGMLNLLLENH